jgi:crotonobetainyl-CoA:carnitine CoA-transferase CaiB-like acyl-CoA transferase
VARRLLSGTRLPDAAGNASPEGDPAPHGVYRCADRIVEDSVRSCGGAEVRRSAADTRSERWLALAVFDDADWARLAALIDAPWTAEPRFATHAARHAHAAALDAQLAGWMRHRDAEALTLALQAVGLAAGVCADAADLCDADPQLAARGYFVAVGGVRLDGPVPRLTATPGRVAAPGPRRDQHRGEVLRRCPAMVENPQWPDGPSSDD